MSRLAREERFHDAWANAETLPDPAKVNEALTSPELRFIHQTLGDVRGLKVLDLGCGLGEASVYFALRGALVTACDLSGGMLEATQRLAAAHGVSLRTHRAASEALLLEVSDLYDVIYVGNLFHHVDIPSTLNVLLPHLKRGGRLISWDPLGYNPLINIYRRIATAVRTPDEHPLVRADVREITSRFKRSQTQFFWLSTLVIFVLMAMRHNPNKVRLWKAVVDQSESWRWLFVPLAKVDALLIRLCPPLRWLCWNVVILGEDPNV